MAELAVASGVAGLLTLALELVQVAEKYRSAVVKANSSVLELLNSLTSLQQVFIQLETQIGDAESTGTVGVRHAALSATVIADCKTQLEDLKTTLQSRLNDDGHLRKRHALSWPFRSGQMNEIVARLGQYRNTFNAALNVDIYTVTTATYAKVTDIETDNRRCAIIEWLTLHKRLVPAMPDNEIDVSKHFYAESVFQDWLTSPGKVLWCYGDAGSGKTILSSILCRDLATSFPANNIAVVAHFYDYQTAETQSVDAVLKNMLAQAIETRGSVPAYVEEIYADRNLVNQRPSNNRIKDALHKILTSMPGVVILIDAFDECQHRKEVLPVLRSLAMEGISILVTSRDIPNIRQQFQQDMRLNIRPQDEDLRELVATALSEIEDELELDQAFKQEMMEKVVARSSGIFLLTRLILKDLRTAGNKKELRQILDELPSNLREMYEKTLDRIQRSGRRPTRLARRTIGWITHAGRPLHIRELRHALAVEERTTQLDVDNLTSKSGILSACLGLVTFDTDDTVRLIHASAYDYMAEHGPESTETVHADLASICLTYLSYTDFAAGPCIDHSQLEDRIKRHAFASYAAQYLGYHCRPVEHLLTHKLFLYLEDANRRESWVQLFYCQAILGDRCDLSTFDFPLTGQGALQTACRLGLVATSKSLIDSSHAVSTPDQQGWSPLHSAASHDQVDAVKLLIENGVALDQQDAKGWTPLDWSIVIGNCNAAEALRDAGATKNLRVWLPDIVAEGLAEGFFTKDNRSFTENNQISRHRTFLPEPQVQALWECFYTPWLLKSTSLETGASTDWMTVQDLGQGLKISTQYNENLGFQTSRLSITISSKQVSGTHLQPSATARTTTLRSLQVDFDMEDSMGPIICIHVGRNPWLS